MAMARTAATATAKAKAKAMSTMTANARTTDAAAATSTTADKSREQLRWDVSKVGQQTQQLDRVYLRGLHLLRSHLMRAPTANHRHADSAATVFAEIVGQEGTSDA